MCILRGMYIHFESCVCAFWGACIYILGPVLYILRGVLYVIFGIFSLYTAAFVEIRPAKPVSFLFFMGRPPGWRYGERVSLCRSFEGPPFGYIWVWSFGCNWV